MKNKSDTLSRKCGLCIALLVLVHLNVFTQGNRVEKVRQVYDSLKAYHVQCPETVLASAIYETGWLECTDCSRDMNNLFGFRVTESYINFSSTSECLAYMKKWQEAFYQPWKVKHPKGTYYEFLCYIGYAADMPSYVKNVKSLERWVWMNINNPQQDLSELVYVPKIE